MTCIRVTLALVLVMVAVLLAAGCAGFFTPQKSQEHIWVGAPHQASSPLYVVGNVSATGTDGKITSVNFTVALAPGRNAVDFEKITIVYTNQSQNQSQNLSEYQLLQRESPISSNVTEGFWNIIAIRNDTGGSNLVLEKNEQFEIVIKPVGGIYKNDRFVIDVKPVTGQSLAFARNAPTVIQVFNIVY